MRDTHGKVVLITGGARGIGLATAKTMRRDGWQIAITDIDADAAQAAAAEIGEKTLALPLDSGDVAATEQAIAQVVAHMGRLDCLFNNAGVFKNEPFLEITEESYDRLTRVNLRGAFFTMQIAAKQMKRLGNGGVIVNMSSASGRSGRATQTIYGMTKAATIHLTKSAALALAPDIRVVAVCPAAVETTMWAQTVAERRATDGEAGLQAFLARFPLNRSCQPEEVAELVAFLASDKAAYLTGCAVDISGGLEMN